jgi:hypothetical protein
MLGVRIDSGQLPSARGKDGYELSQVMARWQSIAHRRFRDDCEFLLQMIDETDDLRLWEKDIGGATFTSRDEFLQKKVLIDYDLTEQSLNEIVSRLRHGETVRLTPLRAHGGDRRSQEAKNQDYNCNLGQQGNSRAYTLARLMRDRPDLAAQVERGELSANAAAIVAGFRKPNRPSNMAKDLFAQFLSLPPLEQTEFEHSLFELRKGGG